MGIQGRKSVEGRSRFIGVLLGFRALGLGRFLTTSGVDLPTFFY